MQSRLRDITHDVRTYVVELHETGDVKLSRSSIVVAVVNMEEKIQRSASWGDAG